jgi:hypothetical protein
LSGEQGGLGEEEEQAGARREDRLEACAKRERIWRDPP